MRLLLLTAVLALVAPAGGVLANDSAYTSLKDQDCRPIERVGTNVGATLSCPSRHDYRVFVVADDDRSWLEILTPGRRRVSLMEATFENAPGEFPNVAGTALEWRYGSSPASPIALIHRIIANDPADPNRTRSTLLVVRLDGNRLCPIGTAATNDAARALADGPGRCP